MATPGVFLLMVLVAMSTEGANSRPTHNQLTALVEELSDKASNLYDDYCTEVSDNVSAPLGMTETERCEHVANEYRAMCNVPRLRTLQHKASTNCCVMYHTLCKYDQLRTSLQDDVCKDTVIMGESEASLCVRLSNHGLTNHLVYTLTPQGSITCSGIDQYLDPAPQDAYNIRGCMLAFLHGLKQQVKQFKDAL